jgi:hypothetical protein
MALNEHEKWEVELLPKLLKTIASIVIGIE